MSKSSPRSPCAAAPTKSAHSRGGTHRQQREAGPPPFAAASALVRSKIIAGFRKASAGALAGGDFEATGIRQLDDERIVGVCARTD